MHRSYRTAALAITAASSLAIFAGTAGAWDDLPCGETEATAHLCAPGEIARDGTVPIPLPVPAAVVVVVPPATPTPPVRLVGCADLPKGAGIKWRRKFGCVVPKVTPLTCAELIARHAGLRSLVARGCSTRPPELRRFNPPVAG